MGRGGWKGSWAEGGGKRAESGEKERLWHRIGSTNRRAEGGGSVGKGERKGRRGCGIRFDQQVPTKELEAAREVLRPYASRHLSTWEVWWVPREQVDRWWLVAKGGR